MGITHSDFLTKCRRIARANGIFRKEVKETRRPDVYGRMKTVYLLSDLAIKMFAETVQDTAKRKKLEEIGGN